MTGAAIKRTSTEPRQRGTNAVRTRPVRVTLDLDPTTYTALNRWIASAAVAVDPDFPRLSLARALRAMVHATIENTAVTDVVLDRLRQEDAPGRGVMP
jgi:hypothetical protein